MTILENIYICFKMTRPYNLSVPMSTGFSGAILAYGGFPELNILLICIFFPVLLWAAGQIINDYLNLDEDYIAKPFLPIPSGKINKNGALRISLMIFISVLLITAAYYSLIALIFEMIFIFGTTLYSAGLKKKGLYGNILFGNMVGSCLIIGGLISNNLNIIKAELIILVYIAIVINHTSLNLVGTFKDLEIDSKMNAETVVQKGIGKSILIAASISALALIASLTPWYFGYLEKTYILIPFCTFLIQLRALGLFYHAPNTKNGFEALKIYRTGSIPLYVSFTAGIAGFDIIITGIGILLFTGFAELLQELITEEPIPLNLFGD